MGDTNVTQVEGLDFTVKDHSSSAAEHMAKSFEHVHKAAEGVTQKLGAMTHHAAMSGLAMVGLGFGFHELADRAKEANMELEGSSKKIAGVIYSFSGWRAGISSQDKWNYSLQEGTEIVEKLEASESKLMMTRGELTDIYKSTYAIGERHNLNQAQQIGLTEKLGAVQRVLGVSADFAATQITRMAMSGKVRGFDDFSKMLRFSVGDLKAFGKLSEEARFQKIQKAMGDMVPAAEGMSKGLAGSLFDMRKAVELLTREVSGPVFKEVTKDFGAWANKLTAVEEGGKTVTKVWGEKLVKAFGYLKDTTAFIADHWKSIAAIFVATKFAGAMQGMAGRFGGGAAGAGAAAGGIGTAAGVMNVSAGVVNIASGPAALLGQKTAQTLNAKLQPSLTDTVGKFSAMAAKVGIVTEGLGLLYVGLESFANWALSKQAVAIAEQGMSARTQSAVSAYVNARRDLAGQTGMKGQDAATSALSHMDSVLEAFGLKAGQRVSKASIESDLKGMSADVASRVLERAGMGTYGKIRSSVEGAGYKEEAALRLSTDINAFIDALEKAYPALKQKEDPHVARKADKITNIYGGVHITQDFKDRDPARIFHRTIEDVANNPTTSGVRTL